MTKKKPKLKPEFWRKGPEIIAEFEVGRNLGQCVVGETKDGERGMLRFQKETSDGEKYFKKGAILFSNPDEVLNMILALEDFVEYWKKRR